MSADSEKLGSERLEHMKFADAFYGGIPPNATLLEDKTRIPPQVETRIPLCTQPEPLGHEGIMVSLWRKNR